MEEFKNDDGAVETIAMARAQSGGSGGGRVLGCGAGGDGFGAD